MAINRKDFGVRIAIEKGIKADEAITKSQVVAGSNVIITYVAPAGASASAPKDIVISSTISPSGANPARMITGTIDVLLRPVGISNGYNYAALESSHASTTNRKFFGSAKFADITHNWGLSEIDGYLLTLEDLTTHLAISSPNHVFIHSHPRSVGVDANTIRIYAVDKGIVPADTTFLPDDLLPSGGYATDLGIDELFGGNNGLDTVPSGLGGYVRFNYTLQEKI